MYKQPLLCCSYFGVTRVPGGNPNQEALSCGLACPGGFPMRHVEQAGEMAKKTQNSRVATRDQGRKE